MIFSVQRYVEDYLERRGLVDNDQYAVKVANLFAGERHTIGDAAFQRRLGHIHTVFFRANPALARGAFEAELLDALDRRFPRKKAHPHRVGTRSQAG